MENNGEKSCVKSKRVEAATAKKRLRFNQTLKNDYYDYVNVNHQTEP